MKKRIYVIIMVLSFFMIPKYEVNQKEEIIFSRSIDSQIYINEKTNYVEIPKEEKKEVKKTTVSKKVTPKKVTVISGIGEKKGNISQSSINTLNQQLNKLPKNVRDRFVADGWHIYVTNENLAKTYFGGKYSNVEGLTSYQNKMILISNNNTYIKESAIHEMGHYIDYYYNYISYTSEFKAIYDEEVKTFKSRIPNSSCVRDPQEFFAETIYYMYTNPSKCTPKAKAYISNLIKNM